jgi:hypothetical protein
MKKFKFFTLALVTCTSTVMGQWQGKMNNPSPERNRDHSAIPMQTDRLEKNVLPVKDAKINCFNPESVRWDFDTVIMYDTLGLTYRLTQTFDNPGHVLIQLTEEWQNNVWENYSRYTYTYDGNGNALTFVTAFWQTNAWMNNWRSTYSYDSSGKLLSDLDEIWQDTAWVNQGKSTHTYDSNGNELIYLYERWQNNEWVMSSRETKTYDTSGNRLTFLNERWQNGAWVNSVRSTSAYDGNGGILTRLNEEWQNNAWVNFDRATYTNDIHGNMLVCLNQAWQSNTWVNASRWTFTRDDNGNVLTEQNEAWQNEAWMNTDRNTYTYDANGNSLTGKVEVWQSGTWQPGIGELWLYCQSATEVWFWGVNRYEATFSSFINGLDNISPLKNGFSVYPNPAGEMITVENDMYPEKREGEITIYNIHGESLLLQPLFYEKSEIDIGALAKGIFLLEVRFGEKKEAVRFVKL